MSRELLKLECCAVSTDYIRVNEADDRLDLGVADIWGDGRFSSIELDKPKVKALVETLTEWLGGDDE